MDSMEERVGGAYGGFTPHLRPNTFFGEFVVIVYQLVLD
jgi:hypothetical protein